MELSWGLLLVVIACAAGAWFWQDSLGARERANAIARETCAATGAQFLDGTVAFRRLRPVRPHGGALQLERTYVFDYSPDGVGRRQGFVVMSGQAVESVGLD